MSEQSIFTPITKALQDILKFSIISYVNTDNKSLDSLITTFFLAFVNIIFSIDLTELWVTIKNLFHRRKKSDGRLELEDEVTFLYWKKFVNSERGGKKFENRHSFAETIKDYNLFLIKFYIHIAKYIPKTGGCIDLDGNKSCTSSSTMSDIASGIPDNEIIPVFMEKGEVVVVGRIGKTGTYISFTNRQVYKSFCKYLVNLIVSQDTPIDNKNNTDKKIYKYMECKPRPFEHGKIYSNRNFNNFISRHKPTILNLLDNFVNVNKDTFDDGRYYGTYNFGMILHGVKGTGKTAVIKAVANYLNRDVVIIDMRLIKNKSQFEKLFFDTETTIALEKYVYVLDEFDFVQGIIKERSHDVLINENKTMETELLKDRKIQLLQILSTSTKESGNNELFKTELDSINQQISDKENALSLETMLTVLDGVSEVRNRCIIATTNYIDRIDSALLREGRFDIKVELTTFNSDEIKEMIGKMMGDTLTPEEKEQLETTKFAENMFTPVQVINIITSQKKFTKIIQTLCKYIFHS